MLTTHPYLVPRSWMSRSYTYSPPQAPQWRVVGRLYFMNNNRHHTQELHIFASYTLLWITVIGRYGCCEQLTHPLPLDTRGLNKRSIIKQNTKIVHWIKCDGGARGGLREPLVNFWLIIRVLFNLDRNNQFWCRRPTLKYRYSHIDTSYLAVLRNAKTKTKINLADVNRSLTNWQHTPAVNTTWKSLTSNLELWLKNQGSGIAIVWTKSGQVLVRLNIHTG
jgi:hypothetical protein